MLSNMTNHSLKGKGLGKEIAKHHSCNNTEITDHTLFSCKEVKGLCI